MKKFLLYAILPAALYSVCRSETEAPFTALPAGGQTFSILNNGNAYLEFSLAAWGPKWSYASFKGDAVNDRGTMTAANSAKIGNVPVSLNVTAVQKDAAQIELNYELKAPDKVPLTLITAAIHFDENAFKGGGVTARMAGGQTATVALPLGRGGIGKQVKECTVTDAGGLETRFEFDPPCDIESDGQGRIVLAEGELAQPVRQNVTVTLPAAVTFYASAADVPFEAGFDQWYPFTPSGDATNPGEIGLQDWLEKPAGKHGRITREGARLMYNGKPVKLWGLNVCYSSCAPGKDLADRRAAFYAKNGVNAVRLHKYADGHGWGGIQSPESFTQLEPAGLDRMDYFVSRLKEAGIYVKLSSTFGVKPGPADRDRIPYLDEFGPMKNNRVTTGFGSIFLSRELQDMQIEQVVNILRHKNPYTGQTYAEDPAIAVIELINEESILFHNTMQALRNVPTLRKRTAERFTEWLQKRYGSEEALLAAWGPEALNSFAGEGFAGESWKDKTIVPVGNPWFYDPEQLDGSQKSRKARLLDTMLFLYEVQNEFHSRYVQALRAAGYEGEILASNWQAGRAFSHYYNLHSDYLTGLIDRHNYFGGGSSTKIANASMLSVPGSAMLSAGMQQADDRPFMLSEWIHVAPTEWGVEGPALIGAYGLGLQGWDVSFMFQNGDDGGFSKQLRDSGWDVTAPQVMGVFPAVARQVLRGDVKESDVKAVRYVHVPSLHEGRIGFEDRVTQAHDEKTFTSDKVPAEALAAARCTVSFTDEYRDTPAFDLSPCRKDGAIQSSTGQLFWQEGKTKMDGFFTINTPATKAVVGFSGGRKFDLGEVTIEPSSRFSAVYVTAQEADKDIAGSEKVLVTAVARARNTGMKVLADSLLLEKGKAPVRMEPVKARITLQRKPSAVWLLDHDGKRTAESLRVENGSFEIDGARDKTCYYLVTFE